MPLYEYECADCHRRTEKIQKFSDPELTICPHCGGKLARTITAPAFQFSGGGWYKDLYSSTKPAASGSEAGTSDSANSGSKSETKSASDSGSSSSTPAAAPAPTASAPAASKA